MIFLQCQISFIKIKIYYLDSEGIIRSDVCDITEHDLAGKDRPRKGSDLKSLNFN